MPQTQDSPWSVVVRHSRYGLRTMDYGLTGVRGIPGIAVGGWRPVRVGLLPARHFLEAIMKAILSATLVLGLCGLGGAQGGKADPVGTWKCEYEIGSLKWMSTT